MKYYYKKDNGHFCIEECKNFINKEDKKDTDSAKIGSTVCVRLCKNFISKNKNYIECKVLNNTDRLKKLNTI